MIRTVNDYKIKSPVLITKRKSNHLEIQKWIETLEITKINNNKIHKWLQQNKNKKKKKNKIRFYFQFKFRLSQSQPNKPYYTVVVMSPPPSPPWFLPSRPLEIKMGRFLLLLLLLALINCVYAVVFKLIVVVIRHRCSDFNKSAYLYLLLFFQIQIL